jgi:hypothetical protein
VDNIVAEVERSDYSAHALINAVVFSMPFRYQSGMAPQSITSRPKQNSQSAQKEHKSL